METKERKLFIVRKRPKKYPVTEQQQRFRQVLDMCGIRKGITRDELVDAMKNCVPDAWRKIKGD